VIILWTGEPAVRFPVVLRNLSLPKRPGRRLSGHLLIGYRD